MFTIKISVSGQQLKSALRLSNDNYDSIVSGLCADMAKLPDTTEFSACVYDKPETKIPIAAFIKHANRQPIIWDLNNSEHYREVYNNYRELLIC